MANTSFTSGGADLGRDWRSFPDPAALERSGTIPLQADAKEALAPIASSPVPQRVVMMC